MQFPAECVSGGSSELLLDWEAPAFTGNSAKKEAAGAPYSYKAAVQADIFLNGICNSQRWMQASFYPPGFSHQAPVLHTTSGQSYEPFDVVRESILRAHYHRMTPISENLSDLHSSTIVR